MYPTKLKVGLSFLCFVVLLIFLFKLIAESYFVDTVPKGLYNNNEEIFESKTSEVSDEIKFYTLKKYDNHLAVFENNNIQPIEVIEVDIRSLPIADQNILDSGIKVTSISALKKIIEDYES